MASQITRTPIGANTPATSAAMNIELDRIVDAYNALLAEHDAQATTVATLEAAQGGAQVVAIEGQQLSWVDANTIGFACDLVALKSVNDSSEGTILHGPTFTNIDISATAGGFLTNVLPLGTIAAEAVDTWYYVWATCDASGADEKLYFSLNPDYATVAGEVPADVAYIRRVGAVFNDNTTALLSFHNVKGSGRVDWYSTRVIYNAASGAWASGNVAVTDTVPDVGGEIMLSGTANVTASAPCNVNVRLGYAGSGSYPDVIYLAADTNADIRAGAFNHTLPIVDSAGVRNVYLQILTGGGINSGNITVSVRGYVDNLTEI